MFSSGAVAVMTVLIFTMTAFNVGYCVWKPTPWNVGMAVLMALFSLREIFGQDRR